MMLRKSDAGDLDIGGSTEAARHLFGLIPRGFEFAMGQVRRAECKRCY